MRLHFESRVTAPQKILVATGNAHKTREIREVLGGAFEVTDLKSHPEIRAADETGATFQENATIKAVEASRVFDGLVLADDSGLEVDALGGAPGVRSARYAAENGNANSSDEANRRKLLAELDRVGARGRDRAARFHCAMALAQRGALIATFDGAVEGTIINREKGGGGFGYDPLFVPAGECGTFAQLSAEVKNGMSHRGRALAKVRAFLSR